MTDQPQEHGSEPSGPEPLNSQTVGPIIVDRRPMWTRPVSATIGRLWAPLYAVIMGTTAFFKPGPKESDVPVQSVARGFWAANTDDRLELQLGSSRPLRNLRRIWQRRGLSIIGKLIGTLMWPLSEINKALRRSDCYDPFAHSVALFHNDPAILAHELGHAEDFAKRSWRTLYFLCRCIPITLVILYQEWVASENAIRNLRTRGLNQSIRRANRVLGGGFGSYLGVLFFGVGAIVSGPLGQLVGFVVMPFGGVVPRQEHDMIDQPQS